MTGSKGSRSARAGAATTSTSMRPSSEPISSFLIDTSVTPFRKLVIEVSSAPLTIPFMPSAALGEYELHYKVWGEGPPALGIMGFALDQRFWASQIPAVTATHRFITFDNRAVGRSTGTPPTSIEEMADDAVALLDHLEIEKTVVFGLSMGGTIAQHLVLDHPGRVSALILGVTWARPLEFMRRQSDLGRLI